MQIVLNKLKELSADQDMTLSELLQSAGVSRNAFYALARRESILPGSIRAIANLLQVPPSSFLVDEGSDFQKGMNLAEKIQEIAGRHEDADRDNIRHTLILLQEKPVQRLRRALQRARGIDIQ